MGRYEALRKITLGSGETSIFDADGSTIIIHVTVDDNVTIPRVIPGIGSPAA